MTTSPAIPSRRSRHLRPGRLKTAALVASWALLLTACDAATARPLPGAGGDPAAPLPSPSTTASPSPTPGAAPSSAPSAPPSSGEARTGLLLGADIETCDLSQFDGVEALAHEVRAVQDPVRSGNCALRLEVNADEEDQGGGRFRAEVKHEGAGGANLERERWFGFSTYLPEEYPAAQDDILFQVHERPSDCEDWRSPPLYLSASNEHMSWGTRWDAKACSDGNVPEGKANISRTPIVRGAWVDWVVHVRWSYRGDGLVEIWQDGEQIATYTGPNTFNDEQEQYLKVGSYMYAGFEGVDQRVSYVDEVRMGGESAGYADVAP